MTSADPSGGPTVFISYSHRDESWKDRLETQLRVLGREGVLSPWTDRQIGAGEDWLGEIRAAMERSAVAVLLVSAQFLTSDFILREEVAALLRRRDEDGLRLIPIIVEPCNWERVRWLAQMQCRPRDGEALSLRSRPRADAALAEIAGEIADILERAGVAPGAAPGAARVGPEKVSLAKLPSTRPELFGREAELAALDAAWEDLRTNVIELVAFGGVGKTALVGSWLRRMQEEQYRGARRVFGWSFYSQGASPDRQASGDLFVDAALRWLGDPDPTRGSAWERGERLAELIRASRVLLILDGLEPLQHPPGAQTGRLRDPSMQTLLRELAAQNPGLCIISTRIEVDDLKDFLDGPVHRIDLEALSDEAGAELLRTLGVLGPETELRRAAGEFQGHALALSLLGTYLAAVHGGDVQKRDQVPQLSAEARQGGHARRVMECYERWFTGKPKLSILRMLGLFDRPADAGAIGALRAGDPIPELTAGLSSLSEAEWRFALRNLRDARILAEPEPDAPDTLDCHPLVREHFADRLRAEHPEAWRKGHDRLYEHLKESSEEFPDTLEGLTPLYAAVAHGCAAGRHQEALDEIYWRRISRRDEYFSTEKLGALAPDLASLASFFDPPWSWPVPEITAADQGFVLNQAGFRLRALGRLAEAVEPLRAALEAAVELEDWRNAASSASNLSGLQLTRGYISDAISTAERSIELADRSGDESLRMFFRATQADALHQAGHVDEAEALFREAEEMQRELQPEYPFLYAFQGYQYCDLLLGQGKCEQVLERAENALSIVRTGSQNLLDIALNYVFLGRARLLQGNLREAAESLQQAVDGLRAAGQQDELPRGLLACAELHRATGDFERARRDLDETLTFSRRAGMRLFEADAHLGFAHLHLKTGELDGARSSLDEARAIVEATGYRRRDEELEELQSQLDSASAT